MGVKEDFLVTVKGLVSFQVTLAEEELTLPVFTVFL